MNSVEANEAIILKFMTEWPALSSNVPYSTDNNRKQSTERFAVLKVDVIESVQVTFGAPGTRKYETIGAIDVVLVGPIDEGRKPLDVLASYVTTIFNGVRIGKTSSDPGIWTEATSTFPQRKHPEFPDSWVLVARTPFQYLETR